MPEEVHVYRCHPEGPQESRGIAVVCSNGLRLPGRYDSKRIGERKRQRNSKASQLGRCVMCSGNGRRPAGGSKERGRRRVERGTTARGGPGCHD